MNLFLIIVLLPFFAITSLYANRGASEPVEKIKLAFNSQALDGIPAPRLSIYADGKKLTVAGGGKTRTFDVNERAIIKIVPNDSMHNFTDIELYPWDIKDGAHTRVGADQQVFIGSTSIRRGGWWYQISKVGDVFVITTCRDINPGSQGRMRSILR